MLTEEQLCFYQTYGYLFLPQAFDPDTFGQIVGEVEATLGGVYGDGSEYSGREQAVLTMGVDTPVLSSLLERPDFLEPARQVYGEDVLGIATFCSSHSGDTGWHADSPKMKPRGMKFMAYLPPVTAEKGALRVVPGSHLGRPSLCFTDQNGPHLCHSS